MLSHVRVEKITHSPNISGAISQISPGWNNLDLAPVRRNQAQKKPNLVKADAAEAECKDNAVHWKWQEAQHAANRDSKNKTQQRAHAAQSQISEDLR